MILGDGADQGVDSVAVTFVPQTRKGAALQLAGVGRAEVRAGEAEIELVGIVELEDKGVGEGGADTGRVDIAPIRSTARTAERIPIVEQRLGAGLLHSLFALFPNPEHRIPEKGRPPQHQEWQKPSRKSPLNNC